MVARVIHFGPDDCHRLMVLRSAGYAVEECQSMPQLQRALESRTALDAVLLSEGDGISPQEAIAAVRTRSSNPVILFCSTTMAYENSGFDLIVPCLTAPNVWLNDVDALIEKRRALRAC